MSVWTRIKLSFAAFFTILFKGRLTVAPQPEPYIVSPPDPVPAGIAGPGIWFRCARATADRRPAILGVGFVVANFAWRATLLAAVNARMASPRLISNACAS